MTQVYVIHGYTASPEEHWFPWLLKKAEQEKVGLKVLRLDPSTTPRLEVWEQQMDEQIEEINENSIFIAHSLGCIATLHFLSKKLHQQKIKQLVPSYGESLIENADLLKTVRSRTLSTLKL